MVLKRNIRDSLVVAHRDTGWRFWFAVVILLSALGTNLVIIKDLINCSNYVFSVLLIFFLLLPGWFLCWVLKLHSHKRSIWLNMIGLGMLRDMILLQKQASGFFWPRLLFECSFHNAPSSIIQILLIWLEWDGESGWIFQGRIRFLLASIALSTLAVGFSVAENTRVSWKTNRMPITIWILVLALFALDMLTRAGVFFFVLCFDLWARIVVVTFFLVVECFFFWWICKCHEISALTLLFSHYYARYWGKRSEIEFGSRLFLNVLVSILAALNSKGLLSLLVAYLACIFINLCIYIFLRGHMHSQWMFEDARAWTDVGSEIGRLSDPGEENLGEIELQGQEEPKILNVPTFASTQVEPDDSPIDGPSDQEVFEDGRKVKGNIQKVSRLPKAQLDFSFGRRAMSEGEKYEHLSPKTDIVTSRHTKNYSNITNYIHEPITNRTVSLKEKRRASDIESLDSDTITPEPIHLEFNVHDRPGIQFSSARTSVHSGGHPFNSSRTSCHSSNLSTVTAGNSRRLSTHHFSPVKPSRNVTRNMMNNLTRNSLMTFEESRQWDKSTGHKTTLSTTLSTVWTQKLNRLNETSYDKVSSAVSYYSDMLSSQHFLSQANEEWAMPRSSLVSFVTSISSDEAGMSLRHAVGDVDAPKVTIWTRAKAVLLAMEEYRDSFKRLNFSKVTVCEVHICDICLAEIEQGQTAYWDPNVVSCLTLLGGISVCDWCFTTNVQGCEVETHTCQACRDEFTVRVELIRVQVWRRRLCSKCSRCRPPCFHISQVEAESWLLQEKETDDRGWVTDIPKVDNKDVKILVAFYFSHVERTSYISEWTSSAGIYLEPEREQLNKSCEVKSGQIDERNIKPEINHSEVNIRDTFTFRSDGWERQSTTVRESGRINYGESPSIIVIEDSDSIYFDSNGQSSPSVIIPDSNGLGHGRTFEK